MQTSANSASYRGQLDGLRTVSILLVLAQHITGTTRVYAGAAGVGLFFAVSGYLITALLVTHDVEEALLMAERVIVVSDRPARIRADIRVEQPRPRRRDHPGLVALREEILALLGLAEAA